MPDSLLPGVPMPGPDFSGLQVPELKKSAGTDPEDLQARVTGDVMAAMKRAGMGGDHFFAVAPAMIFVNGQPVYGWTIAITRATGLPGDAAHICQPTFMPGGFPAKDEINQAVRQIAADLAAGHRRLLKGLQ